MTDSAASGASLAGYGRYTDKPSEDQLHCYFRFDDRDRKRIAVKKGKHNRLGYGLQLSTVRFLGTFLHDPLEVPDNVLAYVARQLDLPVQPVKLKRYRNGETKWDHRAEIQDQYGYKAFSNVPEFLGLVRFLYARTQLTSEAPSILLDLATARLFEHKVLLPGVTTLARLIASVQERTDKRLWQALVRILNATQKASLEALLEVPERSSVSLLDRLRKAPTSVSAAGLVGALKRVEAVRLVGVQGLDLSSFPGQRLIALFRSGMGAKAQAIRRMRQERRIATLLVTVSLLESSALDDALTVFDSLMTDVLNRIDRKDDASRFSTLPSLEEAALCTNALAMAFLDSQESQQCDFATFSEAVFALVSRDQLKAAVHTVQSLTKLRADTRIDDLLRRYSYVQQFVPTLLQTVGFEAGASGKPMLAAVNALRALERRKLVHLSEMPLEIVKGGWEKVIEQEAGLLHRPAYTLCVLENLQLALKRRDLYVPASRRFSDPRKKLLSKETWETMRLPVCRSLDLNPNPQVVLSRLGAQLDEMYQLVEARLSENTAVRLEERKGKVRLVLEEDEALSEPPSLVRLRAAVEALIPRIDLPELLLEVSAWTRFADAFTHLSESRARVEELALSVCAVLLAEACNVGLESVARPEIEALRRGRLSWVDQNYVRAETIASANARLVDFQTQIPTVAQWGDGQLASVDGLRFRVPVKSIHAGHNPKYFGVGSGVTYLNFVSDQFSGFHGIVVPGTLRDSLFVLDGLIEQNTALHPQQLIADTSASSDMVFGLFRLLGPWLAKDSALNLPTCTSAATGVWTNTLTMGDSTISPPRGSTRR